jgi:cyclohexanone monooxygenase
MTHTREDPATDAYDAVIVGAGFAGLYMLHRLRQQGLRAIVLEAADGIGGTWYWNRYPGARCDIESFDYSYSFSPELEQEWEWSERYASQPELLRYLRHVADRFDLWTDIRLRARVVSTRFDEGDTCWHLTTDAGETFVGRFCLMATGGLSTPKPPDIPGLDRFRGRVLSTSRWPADGVDLAGLRVGVVGTGSSAVQLIPELAAVVDELVVFQRTPCFSLPARNAPMQAEHAQMVKADYRRRRENARRSALGLHVEAGSARTFDVTEDERRAEFDARWAAGGGAFLLAYVDLMTDPEANETAAQYFRDRIRETVTDPTVAEALSPTTYPIGARRLCLDSGYYETFNRSNVTLVDLRRTQLEEVTDAGVRTSGAEYELDVLVLALGFDALTGPLFAAGVQGRGGRLLAEAWADGPVTYLGLGTSGFPNLFTIAGPGSPSIVVNVVAAIEQHVEWIADCIAYMDEHGHALIEATPEAERAWTEHVRQVADATLFSRADSYYTGANIAGKPRVIAAYLGGLGAYAERTKEVASAGYAGFAFVRATTSVTSSA